MIKALLTTLLFCITLVFAEGLASVALQKSDVGYSITNVAHAVDADASLPRCDTLSGSTASRCRKAANDQATSGGWFTSWVLLPAANFIINVVLTLAQLWLELSGYVLDAVIAYLVVGMSFFLDQIAGVTIAWVLLRDLANMAIVFILLFIGVMTILGSSRFGYKQLLVRLILVALLMNFSLVIVKGIIDVSNLFAKEMYSKIVLPNPACSDFLSIQTITTTGCIGGGNGLSAAFMGQSWVSSLFNKEGVLDPNQPPAGNEESLSKVIRIGISAIIIIFVVIFLFFSVALILVIRFIVLTILVIFSPLAFAAMILPQTQSFASKWWGLLLKQSFLAPVFFLMLWISFQIMNGIGVPLGLGTPGTSFAEALNGTATATVMFINFAIVIGFMIASLLVARQMGAYGANFAVNSGRNLLGLAAAGTIGRFAGGARRLYDRVQAAAPDGRFARGARTAANIATLGLASDAAIRKGLDSVESNKFGGNISGADIRKSDQDRRKELAQVQRVTELRQALQDVEKRGKLTPETLSTLRNANIKEVEDLLERRGGKALLNNKDAAEAFSQGVADKILSSDKFTAQEQSNFADARTQNNKDALARIKAGTGTAEDIDRRKRLTLKDIELMGLDTITDNDLAEQVSPKLAEDIDKSDGLFTGEQKVAFKKARTQNLVDDVEKLRKATDPGEMHAASMDVQNRFATMQKKVKTSLDADILTDELVAPYITSADLNEMARNRDNLTQEQKYQMYQNIQRSGTYDAKEFFKSPIGYSWKVSP